MRPMTGYAAKFVGGGLAALVLAACGDAVPAPTSTPAATAPASSPTAAGTATASVSPTATSTPAASATPAVTATRVATPTPTSAPPAPASPTPAPSASAASVSIANLAFASAPTVARGGTVTWTNNDTVEHDVTFKDGLASPVLQAGQTYRRNFDAVGSFDYVCSIHPFMTGTVTVR